MVQQKLQGLLIHAVIKIRPMMTLQIKNSVNFVGHWQYFTLKKQKV